jgi:uncharacterized protein (DUF1919 family)
MKIMCDAKIYGCFYPDGELMDIDVNVRRYNSTRIFGKHWDRFHADESWDKKWKRLYRAGWRVKELKCRIAR